MERMEAPAQPFTPAETPVFWRDHGVFPLATVEKSTSPRRWGYPAGVCGRGTPVVRVQYDGDRMSTFKEVRAEMTMALAELKALEPVQHDDSAFAKAYEAARKRAIEAAKEYASASPFGDTTR